MYLKQLVVFGLTCALAGTALAAEVDGQWSGIIVSPTGPIRMTFVFASEGATLTGSYSASDGNKSPVKEGKIEGEKVSFSLDLDFGTGPVTYQYRGEVANEEMKVSSQVDGVPITFTLAKTS